MPTCYIFAGPNGAGKTTFALHYLPNVCNNFLNADEIAKGLSPLNYDAYLRKASEIFLGLLQQNINSHTSFALETTLSGRAYLSRIKSMRQSGWKIILFYLYIPSAEFSAMRVQQRVLQGGHNIPMDDITRRYPRSLANLSEYARLCDHTFCLDNSTPHPIPIFEKHPDSPLQIYAPVIPELQGLPTSTPSPDMQLITNSLQDAVTTELTRKAQLGYNAVIATPSNTPQLITAKSLREYNIIDF